MSFSLVAEAFHLIADAVAGPASQAVHVIADRLTAGVATVLEDAATAAVPEVLQDAYKQGWQAGYLAGSNQQSQFALAPDSPAPEVPTVASEAPAPAAVPTVVTTPPATTEPTPATEGTATHPGEAVPYPTFTTGPTAPHEVF